jgi:branched-chain amino acid transport system substrate-binding protein
MINRIIVVVLSIMLVACTTGNVVTEKPITIGQLAALSSFGSEWGTAERNAVELAINEANAQGGINGRAIQVIVEDTQTDYTQTTNAYKKLVHVDGVHTIIGPTWTEFTQVIAPSAREDHVLLLVPSAPIDQGIEPSPYLFSTFHSLRWQTIPVAQDMAAHGYTRVAIIHDKQPFTEGMDAFFTEQAEELGIMIVDDIGVSTEDKDYRTDIIKLKADKPQAVYVLLGFWPNIGEFMKQADAAGFNTHFYSQVDVESPDYEPLYGAYSEELQYAKAAVSERENTFNEKYAAAYGSTPAVPSAATAYDAANLIIAALRSGATTSDEVSAYLKTVRNYEGASDSITFDESGQVSYHEYVLQQLGEANELS